MQVIILAGGKGTRLKPYTITLPKPLVPLGDIPILEIIIKQLTHEGFTKITLAVGHLAHLIEAYFGDGSRFGVSIDYSFENKPLGTAGPLRIIQNLEDHFLVMNSDDLTDFPYRTFLEQHISSDSIISIGTFQKNEKIDLGVLEINKENQLLKYIEKPTYTFNVSMGIYAFKKEAINFIPANQYFDFPDLIKVLLDSNKNVGCFKHSGYWLDIGRPDDYELANKEFEDLKHKLLR
jgi:NDP-sugar pyrophosphorylase family protein